MKRKAIASSMMVSVGYSASRRILEIEFRGGDVYQYRNVAPEVFRALLAAPSKGRFFQRRIDREYEFDRVRVGRSGEHARRVPVDSSMIAAVAHDARGQILEVEFRSGHVYRYAGVSNETFRALLDARSKGQFFRENIEDVYEFARVLRKQRR
jgi:hypothetical protein